MAVNPKGDLLAISAAAVWALYSILMKEIGKFGFPTIFVTRKIFGYGILFMLPALLFESGLNWQRIFGILLIKGGIEPSSKDLHYPFWVGTLPPILSP